jgi:Domain of unknown function (DUF4055)
MTMATTMQTAPVTGTPLATPTPARSPNDSPDFVREDVKRFAPKRVRCRLLMGGTDAMWDNARIVLPQWPGEDDETYAVRSRMTELYNAFERTVSASCGLVFAKEPTLSDSAPAAIREAWEDVDNQGTAAKVFLKQTLEEGLQDGLVGVLVEYPKLTTRPRDLGEFQAAQARGVRPYWVRYAADQIINWRTTKVDGRLVLSMLVLAEEVDEDAGAFGVTAVKQYRVLRRLPNAADDASAPAATVTFQVWRERTDAEGKLEWFVFDEGGYGTVMPEIPFAIGYIGRKVGVLVAQPPLSSLAELNVGNYRVSADRRNLITIVHAPTPVITHWSEGPKRADGTQDADRGEMKVGPGATMKLVGEQDFKWVQAEAAGLQSSREEKDDQKSEMASISIAYLAQEKKQQETATAHRINSQAQNATLATAAQGLTDMTEQILVFDCLYRGIDRKLAPQVTIAITYDLDQLDAQTIAALSAMAKNAQMTTRTLLTILQTRGVIPDSIDLDDETEELDAAQRSQNDLEATVAAQARTLAISQALAGGGPGASPAPGAKGKTRKKAGKKTPAPGDPVPAAA